ncbi:MAG: fibronectin type III domain-containing protein [Phycisphaerae bacterium]|nr:fibronectin type III domain-containing protein [Gemmatimonadaceae bacterium]
MPHSSLHAHASRRDNQRWLHLVATLSILALSTACVPTDSILSTNVNAPVQRLHVIAAPSDHGVFLSWPDHQEAPAYTIKWRQAATDGWSERYVGKTDHAFVPGLPFGAEHEFVVTGVVGAAAVYVDTLLSTARERTDCAYTDYLQFQSFFCSQAAANEAMRARGVSAAELRCRNQPVNNWGPDAPDCLYTTSSRFRFLLLRNADKVFSQSATPPSVAETRSALRHAIWRRGDPFTASSHVVATPLSSPVIGSVTRFRTATSFLFDDGRPHKSRVTHFMPQEPVSGRYAIFHEGHGESGTDVGVSMIEFLLDRGWEVFAMDMPIHGRNKVDRTIGVDTTHFEWWKLDDGQTSPVASFLLPVKYLVDHITTTRPASENLLLMGRSGGGFTSYVYSAVDPRITATVSVAGGRPISQRLESVFGALELGDLEQTAPELFSGLRHEDLMLAGGTRGSLMMFNTFDSCCFRVVRGDPFLSYLEVGGARTGRVVRGFVDPVSPIHGLGAAGFAELDRFLNEVTR